jgi:hypothetical protein
MIFEAEALNAGILVLALTPAIQHTSTLLRE